MLIPSFFIVLFVISECVCLYFGDIMNIKIVRYDANIESKGRYLCSGRRGTYVYTDLDAWVRRQC